MADIPGMGFSLGGFLEEAASGIGSVFEGAIEALSTPGVGGTIAQNLAALGLIDAPGQPTVMTAGGGAGAAGGIAMGSQCPGFVSTARSRPLPIIWAQNPVTGQMHAWKHAGRPVLFSSDIATAKRVSKLAARAARSRPRRKRR